MAGARLKLGLVIDPEFVLLGKSVCSLTPPLVKALCRAFDTRVLYDQRQFDRLCRQVDFIVSFEPRWAAPVLKWRRAGMFLRPTSCPCYVIMSDPHREQWRIAYFLRERLDYILALYDAPTRRHFTRIPAERIVHFPWAIPDEWIGNEPIDYRGQREVAIFGAARGPAYTLRNWCREQPGVKSYTNSGVENKVMDDREFFTWLAGFDAVIAAGSEDPAYRLTTPKYFETLAAGSLLFAQQTDDLEQLGFVNGENCIVFTRDTFTERLREYLVDPANPRWLEIRRTGRELIRARHTIDYRLRDLEAHARAWKGR